MSWLPRIQIALLVIVILGMLFLTFGDLGSGWSSLVYFAWGMIISVGVLLLNLVISGVTTIFQPRLRKASLWIAAASIVTLLALGLLWRMA